MSGAHATSMAVSLGSISRDNPLSELSNALLGWWGGAGPEGSSVLHPALLKAELISALVVDSLPLLLPHNKSRIGGDWHLDSYRDCWRRWRSVSGQSAPMLSGAP